MKWLNTLIARLSGQDAKKKPQLSSQGLQKQPYSKPVTIVYPAHDDGYTRVTTHDLLVAYATQLDRLRVAVTQKEFSAIYEPAMLAMAEWILNLPRTESEEFSEPGGLLRYSIECAFHCQRMAEQSLFATEEAIEQRRELEKAWCYAAFLAGLFSEVSRLTTFVTTAPNGQTWECFNQSLDHFLDASQAASYYLSFKREPQKPEVNPSLAQRIIPPELIQRLADVNQNIVRVMFLAMEGREDPIKPRLHEIVSRAKAGVLELEKKNLRKQYGRLRQGTHIEPYLVDGLRARLKAWKINAGPAWVGHDGLYVSREGIAEIISFLVDRDVRAIPASEDTVAEMFISMDLAARNNAGSTYTVIYPAEQPVHALHIPDFQHLFPLEINPERMGSLTTAPRQKAKQQPSATEDLFNAAQFSQSADESRQPQQGGSPSTDGERLDVMTMAIEGAVELDVLQELEGSNETPQSSRRARGGAKNRPRKLRADESVEQRTSTDVLEGPTSEQPEVLVAVNDSAEISATPDGTTTASPTQADEGQKLLNVKPATIAVTDIADKLLRQTHDPAVSEFLKAIIHDHNAKRLYGTLWTPYGFAIHKDVIPKYGMDEIVLFTKMHGLGWLSKNPEKPNQKFLEIDFPDGKARALVIKNLIAEDLGVRKS